MPINRSHTPPGLALPVRLFAFTSKYSPSQPHVAATAVFVTMTNYDSDGNASPPPEKQKINYKPYESPPPFLRSDSSESPMSKASPSGQPRKRSRKPPPYSIEEELKIKNLEPNFPDLAYQCGRNPLMPGSPSSGEDGDVCRDIKFNYNGSKQRHRVSSLPPSRRHSKTPEKEAFRLLISDNHIRKPLDSLPSPAPVAPIRCPPEDRIPSTTRLPSVSQLISDPDPRSALNPSCPFRNSRSILHAPATLQKYATEPSMSKTFAALHSPPHSNSGNSPEAGGGGGQSLPSFRATFPGDISTLAHELNIRNGVSPTSYPSAPSPQQLRQHHMRKLSRDYYPPPSLISPKPPFSHISPRTADNIGPSAATTPSTTHPPYWTPSINTEGSRSQSSCEPNPQYADSSQNYPTPTEPGSQGTSEPRSPRAEQSKANVLSTTTNAGFKCTFPNCNAPPFQTQYLLQ
ncbi:hypothetical protein FQN57_001990 [Myotisia sp. PD_48]|nr:hypothetical protein FQN57_001990 [Myotisia sp. PD_48]